MSHTMYVAVVINSVPRGVFAANDDATLTQLLQMARCVFAATSAISMRLWVADEIEMVFYDPNEPSRKMVEFENDEVLAAIARMVNEL